jgi:hypothetical protein
MKQIILSLITLTILLAGFSARATNHDSCPYRNMTKNSKLLRSANTNPSPTQITNKISTVKSASVGH